MQTIVARRVEDAVVAAALRRVGADCRPRALAPVAGCVGIACAAVLWAGLTRSPVRTRHDGDVRRNARRGAARMARLIVQKSARATPQAPLAPLARAKVAHEAPIAGQVARCRALASKRLAAAGENAARVDLPDGARPANKSAEAPPPPEANARLCHVCRTRG
jgi:hypothetical protein